MIPEDLRRSFCQPNKYLLLATDVEQEMKEKGDSIDYKLDQMIHRINVHSDAVEHQIETGIADAKEHFKIELQKTRKFIGIIF